MNAIRVLGLGLLAAGCYYYGPALRAGSGAERKSGPEVRVRLTADAERVTVSAAGGLELRAGKAGPPVVVTGPVTLTGKAGVAAETGGKVRLTTRDTLWVEPSSGAGFELGSRKYRGRLKVFRDEQQALAVVNVLPLEEYLYGVVPCEIGPITTGTIEAVRAQAVAARSFTLTRLGRRQGLGHELFDTYLRDQEYQGTGRETELGRKAVDATRGEVLRFHGQVVEALYHGTCGGRTASGPHPYLRSVRDTPGHRRTGKSFCSASPNFAWQVTLSRDSLERSLGRMAGQDRLKVSGVTLVRDKETSRVAKVRVRTSRGSREFSGSEFRFGLGLKSHRFELNLGSRSVSISGHGWGHGVGLCQDGAIEMARRGYDCRQILAHYYSGVRVEPAY